MIRRYVIFSGLLLFAYTAGFCADIGWEQVTAAEVNDSSNTAIYPGAVFNGKIYMGTARNMANGGAGILSSPDGQNFTVEVSSGFDDVYNEGIKLAHQDYNGTLYAWTYNYDGGAEVWQSSDGSAWTHVNVNGNPNGLNGDTYTGEITGETFSTASGIGIFALYPFYIGTANTTAGCQIWKYDGTTWIMDADVSSLSTCIGENTAFAGGFFNSKVFVGTQHADCPTLAGGLYSSASPWTAVTTTGFEDYNNIKILPAYKEFNGYLYAGTGNSHGSQIWRSQTAGKYPGDWEKVVDFSSTTAGSQSAAVDNNNYEVTSFSIPGDGYLYASLYNYLTGAEIWRTDGSTWEQINDDNFGYPTVAYDTAYLSRTLLSVTGAASGTTKKYLFAGTEPDARLYRIALVEETPQVVEKQGDVEVIGSTERRGVVNPDKGDPITVQFKGSKAGKYTLRIYTLLGEMIHDESKDSVEEGNFSWIPEDIASGIYLVHVEGPGVNIHKKVCILR